MDFLVCQRLFVCHNSIVENDGSSLPSSHKHFIKIDWAQKWPLALVPSHYAGQFRSKVEHLKPSIEKSQCNYMTDLELDRSKENESFPFSSQTHSTVRESPPKSWKNEDTGFKRFMVQTAVQTALQSRVERIHCKTVSYCFLVACRQLVSPSVLRLVHSSVRHAVVAEKLSTVNPITAPTYLHATEGVMIHSSR